MARLSNDGYSVGVFGAPGSGKTTLAARAIHRDAGAGRTCIVYDPTGDIRKYVGGHGAVHIRIDDRHIINAVNGDQLVRAINPSWFRKEPYRVVFVTHASSDYAAELALWCMNQDWSKRYTFVFDEVEEVWSASVPRGLKRKVLKRVRNMSQRLYVTGQRPQYTATILRSNCTHACVFHADSEAFVNPGCKEFADPKLFESAFTLPRFKYLHRAQWREDARAALPTYDARMDALPF